MPRPQGPVNPGMMQVLQNRMQQPQFDQQAINANPQGFQQWLQQAQQQEQRMPGSTMFGQQGPQNLGAVGSAIGYQGGFRPPQMQGFGGGPNYSLQGQPPPGMGTGFGSGMNGMGQTFGGGQSRTGFDLGAAMQNQQPMGGGFGGGLQQEAARQQQLQSIQQMPSKQLLQQRQQANMGEPPRQVNDFGRQLRSQPQMQGFGNNPFGAM